MTETRADRPNGLPDVGVWFRRAEPRDAEALLRFKTDPEVADLLGGFNTGMCHADALAWVERRRGRDDEAVFVIAEVASDACLGHVGLYQIDHRVRSAEFAIMLGEKTVWGRGIGKAATKWMCQWGFDQLNLNRISLSVLESNPRAHALYRSVGFVDEGTMREAQYKNGRFHDVHHMSVLRREWQGTTPA